MQLAPAEQSRLAKERAEIDSIKAFAKQHDISFAEAQALKGTQIAQPGQLPPELSKSIESVRELYPALFNSGMAPAPLCTDGVALVWGAGGLSARPRTSPQPRRWRLGARL
jgi:hypothetical protein